MTPMLQHCFCFHMQDGGSKKREGFTASLLSASELEEISTTDTDASESESEAVMSASDPLAGSMSAGSSSCKGLYHTHSNSHSRHGLVDVDFFSAETKEC